MNTAAAVGRQLPAGVTKFAAIEIGDWFTTTALTITATQIDAYAELTGDHFPIHMNVEAARAAGFAARVAHGLLIMGLVDGLKNQAQAQLEAVATRAWNWDFQAPVLCSDTIHAHITITGKRLTRRAGRGLLQLDFKVIQQDNLTVQQGSNALLVHCAATKE